jgi:hypothetical protein
MFMFWHTGSYTTSTTTKHVSSFTYIGVVGDFGQQMPVLRQSFLLRNSLRSPVHVGRRQGQSTTTTKQPLNNHRTVTNTTTQQQQQTTPGTTPPPTKSYVPGRESGVGTCQWVECGRSDATVVAPRTMKKSRVSLDPTRPCMHTSNQKIKIHVRIHSTVFSYNDRYWKVHNEHHQHVQ